ncbi:MAG: hypothetical protein BM485_11795 [Desulfobulbaceae bacterium DB1]|nr:MAG: hypothetical protein BM485_11795 [Desulfobulbaceae bacterium DB1]
MKMKQNIPYDVFSVQKHHMDFRMCFPWVSDMIREHITANLGIETDDIQDVFVSREAWTPGATDFGYAPFAQEGGLGKVYQLFGEELNAMIGELNEALAA